ncbi:hypothetical protein KVF89_22630 [Nocardioides carbamazepini]|uniref:hypothetical protein n=1 Tax=Nocardioides carbamazepini TaxID=2854259 RepID=UPI00214A5E1F|nr:hypothetical protein [Nocardioides carbamazepini]MCR1785354.1 hypothetical protein [Nocardioides carbamazepini]
MTGTTLLPRTCNRDDCDAQIVLARRADTGRWVPYEAETRDGDAKAGCHVLIGNQAWRPGDLAEHWRVRFQLGSLEKARASVNEYPHHRPHLHLTTASSTEGDTHP